MHTQIRSSGMTALLIATFALTQPAFGADNPGAHEHGSARLQMALEGSRVELMFTSPAYNLAGFEHEARTDEEKRKLADIRDWLKSNPLVNTEAGDCRVTATTVELGGKNGHDHEDHHHHDGHDEGTSHRDYDVSQRLICESSLGGQRFESPLMGRFPELQELTVEWVGATAQGSARLTSPDQGFTP
jgi:hypothetical protein